MSKKEIYTFIGNPGGVHQAKFDREELKVLKRRAKMIKEELDTQHHLHGEMEPTPPEAIAEECYLLGYLDGVGRGINKVLKEMGIYKEVMKRIEESNAAAARLREVRMIRRIRNKPATELLANMERGL